MDPPIGSDRDPGGVTVFLSHDNQCRFFLWRDLELCQGTKVLINNLIRENMKLQEEIKDMKKIRHYGHDQFSLWKIICIAVFFVGNFFFVIVVVKEMNS